MASVENTASPPCCADRTASLRGTVEHGRQRPWPLASRPEQSPLHRAFQCPLQIARPPVLDRSALAQLLEPPYTDPYVRWCGRGGAARLPPIPINVLYNSENIHCILIDGSSFAIGAPLESVTIL